MTSSSTELPLTIEFGGGAEFLFDKVKKHNISLPAGQKWTLSDLILWIRDNMIKERHEFFIQNNTVRPGILVLVNEADWELLGEGDYVLQPNDTVLFISTLHGG